MILVAHLITQRTSKTDGIMVCGVKCPSDSMNSSTDGRRTGFFPSTGRFCGSRTSLPIPAATGAARRILMCSAPNLRVVWWPKKGSESFSIGEQPGLASARFIKIEDPHAQEASLMLRFCLGFGWGLGAGRKETAKKQNKRVCKRSLSQQVGTQYSFGFGFHLFCVLAGGPKRGRGGGAS